MSRGITSDVFDIYRQRPRAAILMSGTGSNAEELLGNEEFRDLYDVNAVVTDNPDSNALRIANQHNIKLIDRFSHGFSNSDERENYFTDLGSDLASQGVNIAIYAGFIGYVSSTVHVVDIPFDSGSAIAVSEPVWEGDLSAPDHEVHDMLQERERIIYPRTLILLGRGVLLPSKIPYNHTEIEELYYAK